MRNRKALGRMQKVAGDPHKVVAAVDRARTSKVPKCRYRTDNLNCAQLALTSTAPTAAGDAVLSAATRAN